MFIQPGLLCTVQSLHMADCHIKNPSVSNQSFHLLSSTAALSCVLGVGLLGFFRVCKRFPWEEHFRLWAVLAGRKNINWEWKHATQIQYYSLCSAIWKCWTEKINIQSNKNVTFVLKADLGDISRGHQRTVNKTTTNVFHPNLSLHYFNLL